MALSTDIATAEQSGESTLLSDGLLHGTEPIRDRKSRLSPRVRWALLAAVGLLSLGGYYAVWRVSDINRPPGAYGAYVALFTGLFALYLFACYLVLSTERTLPLKPALVLVGIVAVLGRGMLLPAPPTLSNDIYRYVWDGRVMAAGISPYQYPPGAAQLAALRTSNYDHAVWQYINRKNAITIYPAGAELFYAGIYQVAPDSVLAMKVVVVAIDLASCAALALLLGLLGMSPTRSIVYAWSPLPIIEFGSSGHVEALSVLWTLLALIAGVLTVRSWGSGTSEQGSDNKRKFTAWSLLAAICLGGAMLVKLIPVLLLAGWFRRFGWRFTLVSIGLFGAVSAIFITVWGGYISPFLGTYLGSEESNSPLYYILKYGIATPLGIPDGVVRVLLIALLAVFALYIMARSEHGLYDFIGKSFLLVGAYLLLATNAHAWYATWLLLFVPLFLPPKGLPIFAHSTAIPGDLSRITHRASRSITSTIGKLRRLGGSYSLAFAALAYTGLTFLGYLGFAWAVPILPWPMVALQVFLVIGSLLLCVPFLNRSI